MAGENELQPPVSLGSLDVMGVEIDGKGYVQITANVGLLTVVWQLEPRMALQLSNIMRKVAGDVERSRLVVPGVVQRPS